MKLDHTEEIPDHLYSAARVSGFLSDRDVGRWRTRHFSISQSEYYARVTHVHFTADHPEHEKARVVPPGDYISLQRRMTSIEVDDTFEMHTGMKLSEATPEIIASTFPPESRWTPIMSDTPAEIAEHWHAINHATGRVLITGLGLGCLPHALLHKEGVESIDIIEIDHEVIELTGWALLTDPRVTIHRGDAANPLTFFEEGTHFDYCWHDIWSSISDRNLDLKTAEHGLSYDGIMDIYNTALDIGTQSAWAWDAAQWMRDVKDEREANEMAFLARLHESDFETQVAMLVDRIVREKVRVGRNADPFPDDAPVPEQYIRILDPDGRLEDVVRERLSEPDFFEKFYAYREANPPDTPLGDPNAHLREAM